MRLPWEGVLTKVGGVRVGATMTEQTNNAMLTLCFVFALCSLIS